MIDIDSEPLEGKKSQDVFRAVYDSVNDPATNLDNWVLPGKLWVQRDSSGEVIALKVRDNTDWTTLIGTVGRVYTKTYTTASIYDLFTENGTVDLAKSFMLLKVASNFPARVRLYSNAAYRAADAGRAATVPPTSPHGVIIDTVRITGDLIDDANPKPFGSNQETTRTKAIPVSIKNISGFQRAITVTFTFLVLEN